MDTNKKFWQRFAWLYAPFMKKSENVYEFIAQRVRPHLSGNMRVLELACGSGQLSFRLGSEVAHWQATDFSENMIAQAQARANKGEGLATLNFSVADATSLPFESCSFDAVMIANALHIMPCPEKAMSEIRRVLKNDGLLFAPTFIHGDGYAARARIRIMSLVGFKTYHKWNEREMCDFVSSHGFEIMENEVMDSPLTPLCCLIARKG